MAERPPSLWLHRDRRDDADDGPFSHARWNARPPAGPGEEPAAPAGEPRRRRRPGLAAVALAFSLLALLATGASLLGGGGDGDGATRPAPLVSQGGRAGGDSDIGRVYAAAGEGVVSIQAGSASGTGFVIAADGTIVTNAHVIGDARSARVRFDDSRRSVSARVLGTDPSTDLAVLDVDTADTGALRPLTLADSDDVRVGDEVVAIGHPFGLDRTATSGIVSGTGRQIEAPNGFGIDEAIQTDAAINPGNSGGPLLDTRARVIGVNSQIATAGGGGNVGIGFAVPANTVRDVVPRLRDGGRIDRGYLGVSTSDAGGGARVEEVVPGSPADAAGLRAGDVIVSVAGQPVDEADDVADVVEARRPGERIEVEVRRGAGERTLDVRLGKRPERAP